MWGGRQHNGLKWSAPRRGQPADCPQHLARAVGSHQSLALHASFGQRRVTSHSSSSRGLYDKPLQDPLLGTLWPSVDAVLAALTGKDKLRLQPTGAYAANLLGLSDQVPARVEFLTDGTSRTVKAGPMQIVLKRTTPRQMAAAGRTSRLVIQALRSLGPEHVTPQRLEKLRRGVPADERRTLLDDLSLAPGWMQPTLPALAADR